MEGTISKVVIEGADFNQNALILKWMLEKNEGTAVLETRTE